MSEIRDLIHATRPRFIDIAKHHKAVNFETESMFAIQRLMENSYLCSIAKRNPDSLRSAVMNIAAVGLSLNPVMRHAYLVPRDGKVCLDVGYLGLIHLAADAEAILWATAEIVRSKDVFEYLGVGKSPKHEFNPMSLDEQRGAITGCYCVAKMPDGEYLVTAMPIHKIYNIRDRSESWKAHVNKGTKTPWKSDEEEMIKKTVIKRAYKTWPLVSKSARAVEAMGIAIDNEPIDFESEEDTETRAALLLSVREKIKELGREESMFVSHAVRVFRRELSSLEDLSGHELETCITMLDQFLLNKADEKKREENESTDED